VAAALLLGAGSPEASAQDFPAKNVRMIVSSGGSDAVARIVAPKLFELWKQSVIVEMRAGAGGVIAMDALSRSTPDGYTVAMVTLSQMLSTLHAKRHQLASEFEPVAFVASTPFAISISATVPAKTLDEWIAWVKAQPQKVPFGSSGLWASAHLCMESFNARAGLDMLHVPYKTSTLAMTGLATGEIKAYCTAALHAIALSNAGKARPLGITYTEPSDLLPGLKPISDKFPGFEVSGWYGIVAPKGTPKAVTAAFSAAVVKVVQAPETVKTLYKMGVRADASTPEKFAAFLKKEAEEWGGIMSKANARP